MGRRSTQILKAALSALYYTGADELLAPFTSGVGVVFMLHHVHPERPRVFEPNRILKVTPQFLERVIQQVLDAGFDVIGLDDLKSRLRQPEHQRPFACFTFDDGYRDNRDHALPIFRRYNLPFAVYVPSDYPDGRGDLWWLALEGAIAKADGVKVEMTGGERTFDTRTPAGKDAAWDAIYWWLRGLPEATARAEVARIAEAAGFEASRLCSSLVMSWDELRAFAADPLVTIGAHTCGHWALAKLPEADARREMADSVRRVSEMLGRPCRHFSYPYGDSGSAGAREFRLARELGIETAVTTRKGLIHAAHADALTALPRFSLNGDFQDARYTQVLLNGAPFAFWSAVERLQARRAASRAIRAPVSRRAVPGLDAPSSG